MTAKIPLTRGYGALVDEADYEELVQFSWHLFYPSGRSSKAYARRSFRMPDGRMGHELMHRRLLPGLARVDHANGNGLDNRRVNLRQATNAENARNRSGPNAGTTSGYRGVSWDKQYQKWRARIRIQGRSASLGRFDNAEEAARAFDAAAYKHYREFAGRLNFSGGNHDQES